MATFCGFKCRLTYMTLFYVFYLVVGASIFSSLEEPNAIEIGKKLQKLRTAYLRKCNCSSMSDELDNFVSEVIEAYKRGVVVYGNTTKEPNWSFGQSLFFVVTVVTTIGYGHVTPISEGGKIFCIILAVLGIPLTLILLSAFVERLMIPTTALLNYLRKRFEHLYPPFNIRIFHLAIVVLVVLVFCLLIPAAVFNYLESDWAYLDSLYYCLISLTTIGLGDYVPGDSSSQPYRFIYKICTIGYLVIGLSFMMLMLTVFYEIPQLNFGMFFLLRNDEVTTDPERVHIRTAIKSSGGPKYARQIDEPEDDSESIKIKIPTGM
ncbi:hypothetical protein CHUAL_009178 [Chamberlinius hualienensis]